MKVGIIGAGGRMGRALTLAVLDHPQTEISGGIEPAGSPLVGQDIGPLAGAHPTSVLVSTDVERLIADSDAIADFTRPEVSVDVARLVAGPGKIHVLGTTGFSEDDDLAIADAAESGAVIVKAGNMSLGVNLLVALTKRVAAALDEDFDIEIVEMHHRHKVDAPSGTALMLGDAAAAGRAVNLQDTAVRVRDGHTGERRRGDIGFATLRGGSVVGEHSVIFAGAGERVELTHVATDRALFANGALKAALWAKGKPPGLYSMMDVLGLD